MAGELTELDECLLQQWADATALRDALNDLEDRLTDQLRVVAERLRPWIELKGFLLLSTDGKYGAINVGKPAWMKADDVSRIYIAVAGLLPYGFRKIRDEHPSVWLYAHGMSKDEQIAFREAVTARMAKHAGEWVNEDCSRRGPVGRYVKSHGDPERLLMARSAEKLELFVKEQLEPILLASDDLDAALGTI